MGRLISIGLAAVVLLPPAVLAQRYSGSDGKVRVALVQQPFSPTGISKGPETMAGGGIMEELAALGASVRRSQIALTPEQNTEYGGWKRLGMALGHLSDQVAGNERDGFFTVGLLATCPSMPGLVAGLQHSGPTQAPLRIGMLWLDAHPDFNTPETTRSGSLEECPSRWQRAVRSPACGWMRTSIRRFRMATSSWRVCGSPTRWSRSCSTSRRSSR